MSDATFDMESGEIKIHNNFAEPWHVTCVHTGDNSMTGGRIKRVKEYVGGETFCLTYGDGVADINIREEIEFHIKNKNRATLAAVQPPGRWGHMRLNGDKIERFEEKTQGDGGWINGGFFVLEPDIFDLIAGDSTIWEREPLETLATNGELSAWFHRGFWRPMDTLRDKMALEKMWEEGRAPWKIWA